MQTTSFPPICVLPTVIPRNDRVMGISLRNSLHPGFPAAFFKILETGRGPGFISPGILSKGGGGW